MTETKSPVLPTDPALARWLELMNDVGRPERALEVCVPDVVVRAYPAGRGGQREVFEGAQAVVGWVRRAPPGAFRFTLVREAPTAAHPDLPPGERAVAARYRVEHTADAFANEGDWVLHARGDRVVALHHAPDPLV